MNQLTHLELIKELNSFKGVTFISCSIETDPRLNKGGRMGTPSNPFFGSVTKEVKLNGAVGFDYKNSVNNQRAREDNEEEFQVKPRAWGTLMEGRKFVEHKDNYYLQLKVENTTTPVYKFDGEVIDKSKLELWLPKRKASSRQEVEKEVIIRDIKLSNIKTITFNKCTYKLTKG